MNLTHVPAKMQANIVYKWKLTGTHTRYTGTEKELFDIVETL